MKKLLIAAAAFSAMAATGAQAAVSASNSLPSNLFFVTDINGSYSPTASVIDTVGDTASNFTTFSMGQDVNFFGGFWNLMNSSGGGFAFGDSGSLLVQFLNNGSVVDNACIAGANNAYTTCGDRSVSGFNLLNGASTSTNNGSEIGYLVFKSSASFDEVRVSYGAGHETYSLSGAIAAVPEPETYAMMLAGLGAIGFMARRRRMG